MTWTTALYFLVFLSFGNSMPQKSKPFWLSADINSIEWQEGCLTTVLCSHPRFQVSCQKKSSSQKVGSFIFLEVRKFWRKLKFFGAFYYDVCKFGTLDLEKKNRNEIKKMFIGIIDSNVRNFSIAENKFKNPENFQKLTKIFNSRICQTFQRQ